MCVRIEEANRVLARAAELAESGRRDHAIDLVGDTVRVLWGLDLGRITTLDPGAWRPAIPRDERPVFAQLLIARAGCFGELDCAGDADANVRVARCALAG